MKKNIISSHIETAPTKIQIMSLNIWGGQCYEKLISFIKVHQDKDITLKDPKARKDVFESIEKALPNHNGIFCPIIDQTYGMAIFFAKTIPLLDEGVHWIYKNPKYIGNDPSHSRCLQWAILNPKGKKIGVFNIHGLWNGNGKGDSPERIKQSESICNFATSLHLPVVLCGDFNLMLDTQSVALLEKNYQNLIRNAKVQSTRSSLYKKSERYADYIFVPKNLNVCSFQVYETEVSDHLPLLAAIEIK
ncbi:hypothetical protein phytr_3950 [Candidatus Phycorickettsia trachydisci]|uniref:Endonuclease/exonuclease/phosphatase domain-containing protein n=1 Tax=Candidatus Phycorickettsia trachydisci TaxID=2115978 RepID=A0A2P1P7V8_9RICK|nr:endonuclease/exonuclease/phosphatase family protein [Candidatus Phycorickettsia trachydisci]AVP87346.1 hypothetical protein phytr_3950 [Candidatus Phycorickettsia trachydisci]